MEPKEGWIAWRWIAFEVLFTLCAAALLAWLANHTLDDQGRSDRT